MFVYLSKKIAIPNGIKLRTVAWDNDQGWIACGGEDGLLKVLKLEDASAKKEIAAVATAPDHATGKQAAAAAAPSTAANLSMNQTLQGHSGSVVVSTWNLHHRKLTTSDSSGLIIVWILYKGTWYEEMINNRNKSTVASMHWNRDGSQICIVYKDGAVIVGSVDGNRLWGKELKTTLAHVQWSPDAQRLLFATVGGELQLYDSTGTFLTKVASYCSSPNTPTTVSKIDWYNGTSNSSDPRTPSLAILFDNGKLQLMRDEMDTQPLVVDTNMRHVDARWNTNGSVLAVSGVQVVKAAGGEEREVAVVQFFDPWGHFLRSLKVPGRLISSLSWEHTSLRIALAVDSFIYFAHVRPTYTHAYFADTLLYLPPSSPSTLVFWNTKTNDRYTKSVGKVVRVAAGGEVAVVVSKREEEGEEEGWCVSVVNAIGKEQECKYVGFEPGFAAVRGNVVVVASGDVVCVWMFRQGGAGRLTALDVLRRTETRERLFHIDDLSLIGSSAPSASLSDLRSRPPTTDPITSLSLTPSTLLLARHSGALLHLSLPSLTLEAKYTLPGRVSLMAVNCDESRVGVVDSAGVGRVLGLERRGGKTTGGGNGSVGGMVGGKDVNGGQMLAFERKDVWDLKWADDNPELLAVMEKTRMYVFRGLEPEEPIACNGYICSFKDLQISAALLDEIMQTPDKPSRDWILNLETKSLRDTRNIIARVGLPDAYQFVEDNPHPRLWKLVGDAALEQLEFGIARKTMVKRMDWGGLVWLKRLERLDDPQKQRAELLLALSQPDAAEKLYLDMDRKDLAIEMRERIGDYFRVVQLIKSGGGWDDVLLERAWDRVGDWYFERMKWAQAASYYAQGRNVERLAECRYLIEDYDGLEALVGTLPENSLLLKDIAEMFVKVGLVEAAVTAYTKIGDVKSAIDTCVQMNQWNTAITLANKHAHPGIEALLTQYADHLLDSGRTLDAIELFRGANYCQRSAALLYEMAEEAAKAGKNPLTIKKMYVLAALEVERYHTLTRNETHRSSAGAGRSGSAGGQTESATLQALLAEDAQSTTTSAASSKFLDKAWRGAEAYHFYILAQRQFYAGNVDGAVKTALHLRDYEDLLPARTIFTLLALVSFYARRFGACSKAFIKLESLPGANEEEIRAYEALALQIFVKFPPHEPKGHHVACTNCGGAIRDTDTYCTHCHITFPTCIASGQPILDGLHFMCHVCKHRAIESEIAALKCCPLNPASKIGCRERDGGAIVALSVGGRAETLRVYHIM
ncbi:uncharacterized protein EV422DRAFT_581893 [Fimicolochytrium jonesii]|uniref:uncharacterized protein n=1 Tax=Fimicolochytrium jonesii TaxID=1396493 RepID=UPI0022FEE978|nr:uncharacterized protein EV422DRAFT_581893 [Fimicolochytrium jonesii]KAI8815756.1 hypothetical protein EV422DRAFT_581893 [Fimicolochytrium jonesii]